MLLKRLLLILAIVLGVNSSAYAFLLNVGVEPYLGYQVTGAATGGNLLTMFSSDRMKMTGFTGGSRVYLKFLNLLFFGPDVSYMPSASLMLRGILTQSYSTPAGLASTTHLRYGFVLGASLPLLPLRFWIGYDPTHTVTLKFSGGNIVFKGYAYKFGAGFSILHASLNLEYYIMNYNASTVYQVSFIPTTNTVGSMLHLTLSLPLTIL
jgi:hypothetical protein